MSRALGIPVRRGSPEPAGSGTERRSVEESDLLGGPSTLPLNAHALRANCEHVPVPVHTGWYQDLDINQLASKIRYSANKASGIEEMP